MSSTYFDSLYLFTYPWEGSKVGNKFINLMLYLHLYYFFKLSELGVLILKLNQDSSFIYVKDVKLGRIVHVESIRKELTKLLWLLLYHNKQC